MLLNKQDYYDLGYDTERWWREHIKKVMPHVRHTPRNRGYDFKGEYEGMTFYVDVKFLRSEYRQKGWIELVSWGKVTGIIQTAKDNFKNDNVEVYIAILHQGRHYLIDAKEVVGAFSRGELNIHSGVSRDDRGVQTMNKHVIMDGFSDPRFCIIEGPLNTELWNPKTDICKRIDIEAWMNGEFVEKDEK